MTSVPWICPSRIQMVRMVMGMHAKMVKSIERVSGAKKTSEQFKWVHKTSPMMTMTTCRSSKNIKLVIVSPEARNVTRMSVRWASKEI